MVARNVHDTISDKDGTRLRVYKEKDRTYIPYSNGAEVVVEKTGDGTRAADGRMVMKEVRTVVSAKGPRTYFTGAGIGPGKWAEIRAANERAYRERKDERKEEHA